MANLNVIMNRNYQSYNSGTVYLLDEGTARGLVNIGVAQLYDVPTSPLAASWRDAAGAIPKDAYWSDATGTSLVKPDGSLSSFGSASYTWANRPSASATGSGTIITITDIAAQPHQRISDGTYWRPMGTVPLLSQLTPVTKTDADTNTQQVFSFTLPAGNFAPPGASIKTEIMWGTEAVVAVTKTLDFQVGGLGGGTYQMNGTSQSHRLIQTFNITSSGYISWWPGSSAVFGNAASSRNTISIDFATARTIVCTVKWETSGAGTHTITVDPLKLWLEP
jgi:hypothetical protein